MEHKFTKLSIALLTLGLSGVALAAGYTPPAPAPAAESGFHIGLEALYVKHHDDADSLRYAKAVSGSAPVLNHWYVAEPEWDWGFRLDAGYHDGDGNDYTLDWTHINDDHNHGETITGSGTLTSAWFSTQSFDVVTVNRNEYDYNQVNFEMGHTFDPHNNFTLRVHAGATYASLEHDFEVTSADNASSTSTRTWFYQDSHFSGVGIRSGADMMWDLGNDFSIFGRAAVGLVMGDIDAEAKRDENSTYASTTPVYDYVITSDDHNVVVPELQGEVGIAWNHDNWTIRGGWRHNVLVHGVKYVRPESAATDPVGETSNYSYGGAFLGVEWRSA